MFAQSVLREIERLQGTCDHQADSLECALSTLQFGHVLLREDFLDFLGDEAFAELGRLVKALRVTHRGEPQACRRELLERCYGKTPSTRLKFFFHRPEKFDPSSQFDEDEWNEAEGVDEIRRVAGDGELLQVFFAHAFPDHYYVCLSDPNPSDPTVFGTDHETFFDEVDNQGPLSGFLSRFLSQKQFAVLVDKAFPSPGEG